jgi:predicted RND superfamily exporter protein
MADFIIKYRWLIIGFCLILGVAFGLLIPSAQVDPDMRNYIPSTMSSRIKTDKIENEFGVQDMVVVLFSDTNIITIDNLSQIRAIDRGISRVSGVSSRISPFTVRNIKSEEGFMVVEPLIKQIPASSDELTQLRSDILGNRFARDIVVSSDMSTATITATISNSEVENRTLYEIDSIIGANPGQATIMKGGLPYIRKAIMSDVNKDGVILVPLALLIMLLVLKLTLGEWHSVLMPFTVVLLSTAVTMGLIPLLGWKMSILSLLVPIILVAVANNYGIYLVSRYINISSQREQISKRLLVRNLLQSFRIPILFSGLTTIAGIMGLLLHSIIPAKQVGILAATGVSVALVMSLLFIPALIYIRKPVFSKAGQSNLSTGETWFILKKISEVVIHRPGRILLIAAVIMGVLSSGIFLLTINTNQETYFPKRHPVRKASDIINDKFGGSQTISVMISGDIKSPEVMMAIDDLTHRLENRNGVGEVFSISQVVREMSKTIFLENDSGYDRIPGTREAIAQMFELYNMSGDPDDFRQLINLDNTGAHILIRLSRPENEVIKQIEAEITGIAETFPAEITVGGYALIMADFAASVIKGQVASLLFAAIVVFVLLTIIFKSLKGGLIGSIPLVASILILFGFMGITGIALDAATALLSSIMIGVGVDFTIQYIWRFKFYILKGLSWAEATAASLQTIGRSIIINAAGVMAGFSALIFSGFTSIRFFGYLVLISIGSCLIGAIIIIPAILMKFKPPFIEIKLNRIIKNKKNEEKSDITGITTAAFSAGSATT